MMGWLWHQLPHSAAWLQKISY